MADAADLAPVEGSFGEYELSFKLATGGMAEIYVARRKRPVADRDNIVVIKRILPHLADEPRFVRMFRDEARLARLLDHENVCHVYEFGDVGETYYLAMEYLHGVPFSSLMRHSAKNQEYLDVRLIVGILQQVCRGLHYAHELHGDDGAPLNLVHRDLSPPNILVTESGVAKVLDFGVAKARGASDKTRTGTIKGKNSYMSPEQVRGKVVDRRSDVFALGILLFESLTTRRLFKAETDFLVFQMITSESLPDIAERRPDLPPELVAVVNRALAQERDDRFASVAELSLALGEAIKPYGAPANKQEIAAFLDSAFRDELDALAARFQRAAEAPLSVSADATPLVIEGPRTNTPTEAVPIIAAPEQHDPAKNKRLALLIGAPVVVALLVIGVVVASRGGSSSPAAQTSADAGQAPTRTIVVVDAGAPSARSEDAALAGARLPAAPIDAAAVDSTVVAKVVDAAPVPDARTTRVRKLRKPAKPGPPGYLSIDSRPYATIYVDGRKIGVTPLHRVKLRPGRHRIKAVSRAGTKRFRLRIRSGKLTSRRLSNW